MKEWDWVATAAWTGAVVFLTMFWTGVALILKARFG